MPGERRRLDVIADAVIALQDINCAGIVDVLKKGRKAHAVILIGPYDEDQRRLSVPQVRVSRVVEELSLDPHIYAAARGIVTMGAFIAAGAAWVAVKQFAPLAAAYSIATKELALQADRLGTVAEVDWAKVAGDTEEAISREHTLWLASRTVKAPL